MPDWVLWNEGFKGANCDNKLGVFDEYALHVCRSFKKTHKRVGDIFEMRDVDGDMLAKFVLAVLWRASISRRRNFSGIALGPYQSKARDVLFGATPLNSLHAFQLLAERYVSNRVKT